MTNTADIIDLASRRSSAARIITQHLASPIQWQGDQIRELAFSDVDAGKAAYAAELPNGGSAFAAVAAAVAMTGRQPEMLQMLADADAARLIFLSLALVDYGDN